MHRIAMRWLTGMLLLTACSCATGAEARVELFDSNRHMRTSEVKPGMTGYGLSVFSGTKLERFDVEVISVMHNQMGPRQNVILIRCKGQGLEHSGAVAGMSGSPIFLKDDQGRERLIGAFALGWVGAKDPVAGVRPIEEMLNIPTENKIAPDVKVAARSSWDARPIILSQISKPSRTILSSGQDARERSMQPLALPMAISGVNDKFIRQMQEMLGAGGMLLQAGGAGDAPPEAKNAKLEPGAAIGVPVISGDLNMSAIGTVTEVIGNRVFAFGHEFNAEGAVEIPMGVGYIHTIIANQAISFKLGSIIRTDGSIFSDESVGIAGKIGPAPAMIPIEITVKSPQREKPATYRYQVTRHPRFTPFGTVNAIAAAIMGHNQLSGDYTIQYALTMEFEGGRKIDIRNQTTSQAGAMNLLRDLSLPVQFALENPFSRTYPTKITGTADISYQVQASELKSASSDKAVYKPGETVRLFVKTRPWRGEDESHFYDVKLPDDLPDGPLAITISDADRFIMDQTRLAPNEFYAGSLDEVFGLMRAMTGHDARQIYIRLMLPHESVAVGRTQLARLPAAKRQILTHTPRENIVTFQQSIVSRHPIDTALTGAFDLSIMVAKNPEKAGLPAPPQPGVTPVPPQQAVPPTPPAAPHGNEP